MVQAETFTYEFRQGPTETSFPELFIHGSNNVVLVFKTPSDSRSCKKEISPTAKVIASPRGLPQVLSQSGHDVKSSRNKRHLNPCIIFRNLFGFIATLAAKKFTRISKLRSLSFFLSFFGFVEVWPRCDYLSVRFINNLL